MKRSYQRPLLFAVFLILSTVLMAQPPWGGGGGKKGPTIKGRITGNVVDSLSGQPVEFATLVLIQAADGKQLDGGITEADGSFKITEVENGNYQLNVSFLGYEDRLITDVETTLENPDLDLGTIYLLSMGINLDEVVVTEEASLIENRIDKLVYNAEKDASTTGGDAADVLRNVPLLSVDLDGNVSLRGSSNIQILINGRPSTMFGANAAEALKTIPANQIKTVEVITTPSAKYDGEGSSGIINIITKKRNAEGFTGSVNSSIGTRQNNGGVNLNWVRGRFGLNGGANSFWSWKRQGSIDFLREDGLLSGTPSVFEQSGPNSSQVLGFNGNFGAFYDFNAYNSINSSVRFNGFNNWRDGTLTGTISPFEQPATTFVRTNDNEGLRSGVDWTTDYKRTFPDSEREFSVAFQLSSTGSNQENITDQVGNAERYEEDIRNFNDGLNQEYTFQVDYVHPFGEKVKLETGVKTVIRRIDSDYETFTRSNNDAAFTPVPFLTDNFLYDQDVYAGYVSFNIKFSKSIGLVAGARYERTTIGGQYRDLEAEPFTQEYDNVLPSIILNKQFKNFSSLKASYSQRIQRPSLFFINPFTQLNDPNNITFGNPNLDPEVVDQYEISYGTFVKGVSVNAAVYYRKTTDIIESFVQIDPNDSEISRTSYLNIGINNSFGVNLFTSVKVGKIGNFRLGVNIFTYNAESAIDSIDLSRDAIVWSGNVGGNINLPRDWKFDLFGFARSPNQTLQGQNPSFWLYGMGLRKEFNKRFSLGVRAIEPFNRNKSFASEIRGENFYQRSNFSIPFRSIGFSLSYNFGQLDFEGNKRGRRSKINNDDQKGGDGDNF